MIKKFKVFYMVEIEASDPVKAAIIAREIIEHASQSYFDVCCNESVVQVQVPNDDFNNSVLYQCPF